MNDRVSRRALLLFLTLGVLWGIPYLLIKYALISFTPAELVFGRTLIGGLVLLPLAVRQRAFGPVRRRWRPVLAYTVAEVAVPWLALGYAEQVVPSGLAALLIATVPIVGLVLAAVTGRAVQIGRDGVAGLVLGLAGVALIVGNEAAAPSGSGSTLALLQMALVVLGYATGPLIIDRWLRGIPSSGVIVTSLLVVAAAMAPWAVTGWPQRVDAAAAIAVVLLGLLCTAAAFTLLFALIDEVGSVRATVITYLNPAVAVVVGLIFLAEPITAVTVAGFAAIAGGSFLVQRRPHVRTEPT